MSEDRVATCADCGKARWSPRVPEAFHGWVKDERAQWLCRECVVRSAAGQAGERESKDGKQASA